MARKKKDRNGGGEAKLEMTPMIDVVFQLLIFFIVTLKQEDILSQLEAMRPAPDTSTSARDNPIEPVKIQIDANGLIFRGRPVSRDALAKSLATVARFNPGATVIINCLGASQHKHLIEALDACSENGLNNLAVFSL